MIDDIINDSFLGDFVHNTSLDAVLIGRDIPVSLSADDVQREIKKAERMLAKFYSDPQKYSKSIARFEEKVTSLRAKKDALSSGGGAGRPPRQPTGMPIRDEYQKEKAELVRYFSKDAVSAVLKTPQDEMYAVIAVRTLGEMGIKLADYETGLPQDYKLEVLRRSGEF